MFHNFTGFLLIVCPLVVVSFIVQVSAISNMDMIVLHKFQPFQIWAWLYCTSFSHSKLGMIVLHKFQPFQIWTWLYCTSFSHSKYGHDSWWLYCTSFSHSKYGHDCIAQVSAIQNMDSNSFPLDLIVTFYHCLFLDLIATFYHCLFKTSDSKTWGYI